MAASDIGRRLTGELEALIRSEFDRAPKRLGIAVSGGGDSMALLDATIRWAADYDVQILAATVDHGLRPEAKDEAALVASFCEDAGVEHEILSVDVAPGSGVMARARNARYAGLRRWGQRHRLDAILLGHTQNDVAETLLMRLARGTGLTGLAAMPVWWRDEAGQHWGRPFLEIGREDLRAYLRERSVPWAEDPSNEDPRFERVRTRQQMHALGLDPAPLARSARALAGADKTLRVHSADLAKALFVFEGGDVIIDGPARLKMQGYGFEQTRRLVTAILRWIGGKTPRGEEVTALFRRLGHEEGTATLAGCLITQSAPDQIGSMALRVGREPAACELAVPLGEIWDGRWHVIAPAPWRENSSEFSVSALGGDVPHNWRDIGLPKSTLQASPAVRNNHGQVIAAPLAGLGTAWSAQLQPDFFAAISR